MSGNAFCARFGLAHPIVQAPMAGGFTPPDFVAAAANAGVLGSLGAAYLTPAQITADLARIGQLTDRPVAVNLFAGGYATENKVDPAPMLKVLGEIHAELKLPPPVLPPLAPIPLRAQIAAVIAARPAIFTFAFGIPDAVDLARVRAAGLYIIGTATNVAEAQALAAAGVDAIAAQGGEAGAHRGTFIGRFEDSLIPIRTLLPAIVKAVPVPVIAAGGLMTGADIAEMLRLGATAAQLGTAFLCCPEAGTPAAHKAALLAAKVDTTAVTRAYSGRYARGLVTDFMRQVDPRPGIILPFPLQNDLTRLMRGAAGKAGNAQYLSLWAGQSVSRCRALPVAELVRALGAELAEAR